ncbi:MAG: hypothetical protein JO117_11130 [Verrucomicrobia bacterium]|nr:hypothetical protein [Verrucomicrobiota bacterium]MBV9658101.1 hypothetical protein [Verrucomicrobiota bacterium]
MLRPICFLVAGPLLGLSLILTAACERHPAGEPALWYGHGSGKEASKDRNVHWLDGSGTRFTDSQGTEIAPPEEESREGQDTDPHAHPNASFKHETPNRAAPEQHDDAGKPAKHE